MTSRMPKKKTVERALRVEMSQLPVKKLLLTVFPDHWTIICGTGYEQCPFRVRKGRHHICLFDYKHIRGCILYWAEELGVDYKWIFGEKNGI